MATVSNQISQQPTVDELLEDFWNIIYRNSEVFADRLMLGTLHECLTFEGATRRSNHICEAIKNVSPAHGLCTGVFLDDPLKAATAILGIWKAGGVGVPLDVAFPETTLTHTIETTDMVVILTDDENHARISTLAPAAKIINLNTLPCEQPIDNPTVDYSPDDLTLLIFTSGSTGNPKGVVLDYRYLARALQFRLADTQPDDRFLRLTSFAYVAFYTKILAVLFTGTSLYFYRLRQEGFVGLADWIRQEAVTEFGAKPTVFRSFVSTLKPDEQFPSVRKVRIGGERRYTADIEAIRRHFPSVTHIGMGFASTETHAIAWNDYPLDYDFDQETLPVGKPRMDTEVCIWDEAGNPLPPGEAGEMVVHAAGLARGYWHNPELTQQRFLPDPDDPGKQYFKTGDIGKLLPDGQLVFLGRSDNRIKLKGIRIELSSIEKYILAYPGIMQVASKVIDNPSGNQKLASYFVAEEGVEIPISDLRKFLADRLPRHLLPHYLVSLEKMPTTPSGKVDLKNLPLPNMVRPDLGSPPVPPLDDLEEKLVAIWEDRLGITGIGITDDFFDLGGDSLLGVLLFVRIEEVFGRNLPVSVLLTAPTIRKQAEILRVTRPETDFSGIITINEQGNLPPLFFIPGKGGYPTRIRHLARQIAPQSPIYALQEFRIENIEKKVETLARHYIDQIRRVAPQGPYHLVGESAGGKVALEMAQQFAALGEEVPVLALLDSFNIADAWLSYSSPVAHHKYYRMLLNKHLQILVESNWRGRIEYLNFYRGTFFQKLARFLSKRLRKPSMTDDNSLPEKYKRLEAAIIRADRAYLPRPYPGRVILFKALRGPAAKYPANGWDQVEFGELVVHPLDCYHGGILFEPAVSQVAEILQTYIDEYQETRE